MSESTELNAVEREALNDFREGASTTPRSGTDNAEWAGFGLRCLLEASRVLRARSVGFAETMELKGDGSPTTLIEVGVEEAVRARLSIFEAAAAFVGEETGGELSTSGFTVAVDPVDGTWAFLTETPTWASTLAVFRDGQPFAGFVANPVTGDLAYAIRGSKTRHLRISTFGETDAAFVLPRRALNKERVLVSLHPSRAATTVQAALQEAWGRQELSMLRSPGGSPAWGLFEAARGHFVYVNVWSQKPAEPFDLAAGVLLVRGAGGEVTDLEGAAIDSKRHAGPWVAGVDAEQRAQVTGIVRESLSR
jgi:fructose-1,6-bisphosphatase/inositol monophosphatase family enzyme